MRASPALQNDTKWIFLKKGTCSRTMFYILNRDFGFPLDDEERASDPLAGGVMQQGYQCGMLWGSAMAVGAEAYRRCNDTCTAIRNAVTATQELLESFTSRTGCADCYELTDTDFSEKFTTVKYMLSGKFISCFRLADRWAPEAIDAAKKGLSRNGGERAEDSLSCASEVVRRIGGSGYEMAMVAGFAGGYGLSGNSCGALAAAIWMRTKRWCQANPGKSCYSNPDAADVLETFLAATDYQFLCTAITGKQFSSLEEHTQFLRAGGCEMLIQTLSSG